MHFSRMRLAGAVACALLCAGAARADGPHDDDQRIEVIGHYENAVGSSDAASQGYITPARIESRPLLRPAEVLESVPGLVVTQHSGEGKANQFFLRGFNLDHGTDFATTVAGTPVNMPTHAHGQGYSDLNFLIPELVARVDYRKGPYFAQSGDFSSAGAADFHYQDKLAAGIGSVTLGSFNYRRLLAADSRALGKGELLYAFEALGNDGPWDVPSRYGKQNAVLRYTVGSTADRHQFTAMAYQGRWTSTDQIPQRAVDRGLIGRFGSLDPTDGGNSQRYSLAYERRRSFGSGEFQLNAYALRYRMQLYSDFTYFLDKPATGDQFEQGDRRTVYGLAPTWFFAGRLLGRESTLKLGLALRQDDIDTVDLYDTAARQRVARVRSDSVAQTGAGAFAEHSLQWNDWLRSVMGLRADAYRARVRSDLDANSGRTGKSLLSPKLRLVFGPFEDTEFFLAAGLGFHSNDARGTSAHVDPRSGAAVLPAPALVRSKGQEAGLRTGWIPGLQSSLVLWRLTLESELVFAGDAGTTQASRPSIRQGIEWSNRYTARPGIVLDADLSVSRARFRDDDPAGNRIPGAIDRVATFAAAIDRRGPWSGALTMRYFGPRPLLEDASVRSRSTLLWNARVGYHIERGMRLSVDVLNLFDRRASDIDYFYASRLRGEAVPASDIHFHPVEPRALRIALSVAL